MKYSSSIAITTFLFPSLISAIPYTWPDPYVDDLEDYVFLVGGMNKLGFTDNVTPCSAAQGEIGRQTAAEWIRTAYHDMATADVQAGTGGLDASIFETDRPENIGAAFNTTADFLNNFYSKYTSMSDLLALSVRTAVANCGGPHIPFRIGRVDAICAGRFGVPQPQENTTVIQSRFVQQGFNQTDMITLVACGHTLGGVHGQDFPTITGSKKSECFKHFDATFDSFDGAVAREYVDGTTLNPLVTRNDKTMNSDLKVFSSDGNQTMKALIDPVVFKSRCETVLGRMIDTVPNDVGLSEPLKPIEIKPIRMELTIEAAGNLKLSGSIRQLIPLDESFDPTTQISLLYADRSGTSSGVITLPTPAPGINTGQGYDEEFQFYDVDASIPSKTGFSYFNVSVTTAINKIGKTYDNNGQGFAIQSLILLQYGQSCDILPRFDAKDQRQNLTVVAAVHKLALGKPVILNLDIPEARPNTKIPTFISNNIVMEKTVEVDGTDYTLYAATYMYDKIFQIPITFEITTEVYGRNVSVVRTRNSNALPSKCGNIA